MGTIDGIIEPIYFLITSIAFIILSLIQYKKVGKSTETIYLSILAIVFLMILISKKSRLYLAPLLVWLCYALLLSTADIQNS